MKETVLTWNMTNWITVVLMALVGFALLAAASQGYQKLRGNQSNAA